MCVKFLHSHSIWGSSVAKNQTKPSNMFVNPFIPNAPFLYPLKASENRKVFWCFQRVEKGCIGNEWVKIVSLVQGQAWESEKIGR